MKPLAIEEKPPGFDLTVTHRDEKTGLVTHSNPYVLRVLPAKDGSRFYAFERPVGSGNLWNKGGAAIGRWVDGKLCEGAKHIEFKAPETSDQKLSRTLTEKDNRIADLEKRLIELEAKKKQGS